MAKIPKRIICLVAVAVILCAHVPVVHAEALPNILSGSSTVADIVMSYYAVSGSAVANTDWINTLYDSLGSNLGTIQSFAENGYLVTNPDGTWYATQALEQAIENAPAYQSLGLDEIFNVSAQEAAAGGGLAASTGAATLAGATGAVGSVGVIPLLGGVTAAYWGGIGLGTLIAHKLDLYGNNIKANAPITIFDASYFANNRLDGDSCFYVHQSGNTYEYFMYSTSSNCRLAGYRTIYSGKTYVNGFAVNVSDSIGKVRFIGNNSYSDSVVNVGNRSSIFSNFGLEEFITGYKVNNIPNLYENQSAFNTATLNWINGQNIPALHNFSPDMIGPTGNLNADTDPESGNIIVPDMLPQVDPSVQSGKPLTLEDWLRFANGAKSNNSDPDGKTKNKKLFDDILDEIKQGVPSTPDNPDPDPDPYHPPTPTPVPDPDYGDPNPDQPEFESETDVPDPVDTGNPWVTPDLLDKFPFCIPKDMIDMVKGFKSADRTAPHISWNFKSPVGHVDYTFNLDLEDFEDVATLLRALELAAFIVGLAFATRYLIGAS